MRHFVVRYYVECAVTKGRAICLCTSSQRSYFADGHGGQPAPVQHVAVVAGKFCLQVIEITKGYIFFFRAQLR